MHVLSILEDNNLRTTTIDLSPFVLEWWRPIQHPHQGRTSLKILGEPIFQRISPPTYLSFAIFTQLQNFSKNEPGGSEKLFGITLHKYMPNYTRAKRKFWYNFTQVHAKLHKVQKKI